MIYIIIVITIIIILSWKVIKSIIYYQIYDFFSHFLIRQISLKLIVLIY